MNNALDLANEHKALMERAWALVCPTRRGAHWKDRISQLVVLEEIEAAGVELFHVHEAIEFFTATEPHATQRVCVGDRIVRKPCGGVSIETTERSTGDRIGWYLQAPGYRAGPAGDR